MNHQVFFVTILAAVILVLAPSTATAADFTWDGGFDPTWDYELYDQFIRRVRRRGNMATRVFVPRIVVRDTIDEVILQTGSQQRSSTR